MTALLEQTSWLTLNGVYQGTGILTFTSPQGVLNGNILVTFDDKGKFEILFMPQLLETDYPNLWKGWLYLVKGNNRPEVEDGIVFPMNIEGNPCQNVEIQIQQPQKGRLIIRADEIVCKSRNLENSPLSVIPLGTLTVTFLTENITPPHYWSIPLVNYVGDMPYEHENDLLDHPMRIKQVSSGTKILMQTWKEVYQSALDQNRRLIHFTYNHRACYIDPLLDYGERCRNLRFGKFEQFTTCVLVGEFLHSTSVSLDKFDYNEPWFPYSIFQLLSVASGTAVGCFWIEIRDENTDLIARHHVTMNTGKFYNGLRAIDMNDCGKFLSNTLFLFQNDLSKHEILRTVAREIGSASFGGREPSEAILRYCRAIELMYSVHPELHTTVNLLDKLNLTAHEQLKNFLSQSTDELTKLRASVKNKDTINVINTIRQKLEKITIEQPPKTINSKLEQLAMHYSLDDFVIISSSEIKTLNVIDKMRNGIAHDGNFFPSGYKMQRLRLNAYRHLADLTIRIFLSWIDFTGRYKSPIGYVSKSKEWVEKNLSHKALGYD